jgi:ketosteroid isomerase-like protein
MGRPTVLAASLLALLSACGTATAAGTDAKGTRAEVQAFYNQWLRAWKKKDIAGVMAPTTPDYVYSYTNGQKRSRAQIRSDWSDEMRLYGRIDSLTMTAGKVERRGNEATDTSTWRFKGTYVDPGGKSHPATELWVTRDLLVKTAKGWMFKRSKDLKVVVTLDGKPVPNPYEVFPTKSKALQELPGPRLGGNTGRRLRG